MLKDIKYLKVLVKVLNPITPEIKFQIFHNKKNVISLDDENDIVVEDMNDPNLNMLKMQNSNHNRRWSAEENEIKLK